jgi:hypothetical protein
MKQRTAGVSMSLSVLLLALLPLLVHAFACEAFAAEPYDTYNQWHEWQAESEREALEPDMTVGEDQYSQEQHDEQQDSEEDHSEQYRDESEEQGEQYESAPSDMDAETVPEESFEDVPPPVFSR